MNPMSKVFKHQRHLYAVLVLTVFIMMMNVFTVEASEKDYKDDIIKPFLPLKTTDDSGHFIDLTDDDILLEGLKDGWEYYYQLPTSDTSKNNKLVLTVQYSELLESHSNISVYIDGKPVKSAYLDKKEKQLTLEIPLKKQHTKSGTHQVNIVFNGYLSEEICSYDGTSASWLVITPSSYLELGKQSVVNQKDILANYPYPFVDNHRDEAVNSKIVLPNEPTYEALLSAIQMAQYLNNQSLNSKVEIIKEDALKEISEHLIFVGAKDAWGKDIGQIIKDNVSIEADKMAIKNLFVGKKSNYYQMLFVTADQDQTIYDHVQVLTLKELSDQLSGLSLSVDKPLASLEDEKNLKKSISLGDMDIASFIIHESRKKSQNFSMVLGENITPDSDVTFNLKYKISRTLLTQIENKETEAELVVYINNVPHSVAIKDVEDLKTDQFIETKLFVEPSTLIGQRNANVQFEIKGIDDDDDCTPPQEDQWIYIDNSTHMNINTTESDYNQSFKNWPNLVDNHALSIVLPKKLDQSMINQMYLLMASIDSPEALQNLNIMSEDDLDEDKLAEGHVIYIGKPKEKWLYDPLEIAINDDGEVDISAYNFVNETAESVTWAQASPWNKAYHLIVFTGQDESKYIRKDVLHYMNALDLDRDIIVQSKNGKVFSHLMDVSISNDESVESLEQEGQKQAGALDNFNWFIIGIAVLIILSLIILITRYKKSK